jgi:hypothetical protein
VRRSGPPQGAGERVRRRDVGQRVGRVRQVPAT